MLNIFFVIEIVFVALLAVIIFVECQFMNILLFII